MHVAAAADDGDVLLFHNCNMTLIVRPKACCFPILLFHYCLAFTISCLCKYSFQFDVLKSDR